MSKSKEFDLLVGRKPVRGYITAAIVAQKQGVTKITVKSRGRSISKAVDVAEILKREPLNMKLVGKVKIGTQEFAEDNKEGTQRTIVRRVSTIEITLKVGGSK